KTSPWARRRKIELAELAGEPWLLPHDNIYSSFLTQAFQANGLSVPKVSVKSYSIHQRISLLATGRFLGPLSGSVLRFNADHFPLKVLRIDLAIRQWPVAIVTLKNRMLSPVVQTFIDSLREVTKPMARSARPPAG